MLVGIEDQVFLPADFIICRGDIGNEMYFLREGFAGVFTCHFAKNGEQVSLDPGWSQDVSGVCTRVSIMNHVVCLHFWGIPASRQILESSPSY